MSLDLYAYRSLVPAGPCAYCDGEGETVDHVIPFGRPGGTDEPDNLVRACRPCNSSKGNLTADEWLRSGRPRARVVANCRAGVTK